MFMLFCKQRILPAADFLQNVVSINVQLMEEEKASDHYFIIVLLFVHQYESEEMCNSQLSVNGLKVDNN